MTTQFPCIREKATHHGHGKLNVFQRLMLQWSQLHPYNAVHVYKIALSAAPEAFRDALIATHRDLGLGSVQLCPAGKTFRHSVDDSPEVTVYSDSMESEYTLSRLVAAELNRRFQRPQGSPWHFSLVAEGPEAHYVVLTYDHWVADSTSARMLARHVLDRYCQSGHTENRPRLNRYPGTYRETFPQQLSAGSLCRSTAHSLQHLFSKHRAAQITYSLSQHSAVGFDLYRTESKTVDHLRHFARSQGATVHDVILAALGLAIADVLPQRALRQQRPLALGTIVDIRGESTDDLSDTFGMYLGNYLVCLTGDARMGLADATRLVAAATAPIKSQRAYFNSLVSMKAASVIWPRLSQRLKRNFYPTFMPLTAGVSNVVVRDAWLTEAPEIVEYFRAASTGPITPLVLSPTTLHGAMNLGVTYRLAGFSQQKLSNLMNNLIEKLEHPFGGRLHRTERIAQRTGNRRFGRPQREMAAAAG